MIYNRLDLEINLTCLPARRRLSCTRKNKRDDKMVEANPREEVKRSASAKPKRIQDEVFQGPYKFVCSERPESFSYYERLNLDWCQLDNYYVYHKLGRGKYSEVFEGANLANNQKCVIKILKPVRIEKQYREVKILQPLYGGPNIVKLFDVYEDERFWCLVMELMKGGELFDQILEKDHFSELEAR